MKLGKIALYTALAGGVAVVGDSCHVAQHFRDTIGSRVSGALSGTPRDSAGLATMLREEPDSIAYGAMMARVKELKPETRLHFVDRSLHSAIGDSAVDTRFGTATYKQLVQLYFNLESDLQDRINSPRTPNSSYKMLPSNTAPN